MMARKTKSSNRKRGAPQGNLNALKHGFYSRQFREQEGKDLEELEDLNDLGDEIMMLRVAARRLFEMMENCQDAKEMAAIIRALGVCTSRLAIVVKAQHMIKGGRNEEQEAIREALRQVHKELELSL